MSRDGSDFAERFRQQIFDEGHDKAAAAALAEYLSDYDGALFETYGAGETSADRITGTDLVAVTLLSMEIRRGTTAGFTPRIAVSISERADDISEMLRSIPEDPELHTLTEADFNVYLGDGSPADRLWSFLRNDLKTPRVATFKLLARKRPHLLPIRDTVVEAALGNPDQWWRNWWVALAQSPDLVARLEDLRTAAATSLSLLRVADSVIWMRNRE